MEGLWSDDGMVFRLPESDEPPDAALFLPAADEIEDQVVAHPRPDVALRRAVPGERGAGAPSAAPSPGPAQPPLGAAQARRRTCSRWRRATGPSRSSSRPTASACATSSTCPGLTEILRRIASRRIRVVTVDSRTPSPFAGLAPLFLRRQLHLRRRRPARRAARAGALGRPGAAEGAARARRSCASCSTPRRSSRLERSLQRLEGRNGPACRRPPRSAAVARRPHRGRDRGSRRGRGAGRGRAAGSRSSTKERRAIPMRVAGAPPLGRGGRRGAAARRARHRCAAGASRGVSGAGRRSRSADLLSRYARTHGPFRLEDAAGRLAALRWASSGWPSTGSPSGAASSRAISCPDGRSREWCDAGRSARDQAPLAREAAPRGRAGRAGGLRPIPGRVAGA